MAKAKAFFKRQKASSAWEVEVEVVALGMSSNFGKTKKKIFILYRALILRHCVTVRHKMDSGKNYLLI